MSWNCLGVCKALGLFAQRSSSGNICPRSADTAAAP